MAGNKPTAVHFSLIFFVMMTLISCVITYLFYKELEETNAQLVAAQQANTQNEGTMRTVREENGALKRLIGYNLDVVGADDPNNPAGVYGASMKDFRDLGAGVQEPTWRATVIHLRTQLNTMEQNLASANLTNTQKDQQYANNQTQEAAAKAALEASNRDNATIRAQLDSQNQEEINKKTQEITSVRTQLRDLQGKFDDMKKEFEDQIKVLEAQRIKLVQINDQIREKLENATTINFDQPDGMVQAIDHRNRTVWINLGDQDKLPVGLTFSVYRQNNSGVGQTSTTGEIKATIIVTDIVKSNLAEARIVNEFGQHPIVDGDPIFTPLWSPGTTYRFSLIGAIDLDNDGYSDRELLRQLIKDAGSTIDNEVTDDGERIGKGITVQTKFLVVGDIPDMAEVPPNETEKAQKIIDALKEMREEARFQGVRVVSLNDFKAWMGWESARRFFRPGDNKPFTIKAGQSKPEVDDIPKASVTPKAPGTQTKQTFGPNGYNN